MKRLLLSFLLVLGLASPSWSAISFVVAQSAAPTSNGGTQDFTSSGFGTPLCALFFANYGVTNGTAAAHTMFAVGGYDGTRQNSQALAAEDAQGTSDTGGATDADSALITVLATDQTKDGDGTASFITDGARLTWADAPPTAYLVNAVLLGGTGVSNCYVNTATSPATQDTATTVSSVGFLADFVIVWSANGDTANMLSSVGFVANDGSNTQRSLSEYNQNAAANMNEATRLSSTRVAQANIGATPTVSISNFTSSGFDVFDRDGNGARTIGYMAVKLNGLSFKVLTSAAPNATGSYTHSGVGFTPQFGLMLQGEIAAVDTNYSAQNGEVFAVSAFTATNQVCAGNHSADADTTSIEKSLTDVLPVCLYRDGAAFATASFTTFTNDGPTFNYSVAPASVYQWGALFVQTQNINFGSLRRRFQ